MNSVRKVICPELRVYSSGTFKARRQRVPSGGEEHSHTADLLCDNGGVMSSKAPDKLPGEL
jgi:hypothetical protein